MSDRNRTLILYGLLLFVPFIVFFPTLEAGFLNWDDDVNVFNNPKVQGLTGENLAWMFTDFKHAIRYKPLSWLSWAIVHEFSGLNPFGYHLANVLVHCANCVLLFLLLQKLIRIAITVEPTEDSRRMDWLAAGAAILWAVHPMRVEPVAWVTGLPYGVAFLFAQIATLLYLKAINLMDKRKSAICYTLSVTAFGLASVTYPIVLGFPAALIAIEFFPLKRFATDGKLTLFSPDAKAAYLRLLPFILISVALIGWTVYGRFRLNDYWIKAAEVDEFGYGARFMQAAYVWAYYVWKPLWPTDLAPVYTELIWNHPLDTAFVISLLLIVAITGVLIWSRKQWPAALAIWIAHLGILVPMLGLTERPHYTHDRYGIINGALWPIAFVAFAVWSRQQRQLRNGIYLVGIIGILACSINSHALTRNWTNNIVFFTHMSQSLGENEYQNLALMNLGEALTAEERYEEAISCFERAANQDVPWIFPFDFLRLAVRYGEALTLAERYDEAESQFARALSMNPNHSTARVYWTSIQYRKGNAQVASQVWQTVVADFLGGKLRIPVRDADLMSKNESTATLIQILTLTRNLQSAPTSAEIHEALANAYGIVGDKTLANHHREFALRK